MEKVKIKNHYFISATTSMLKQQKKRKEKSWIDRHYMPEHEEQNVEWRRRRKINAVNNRM